VPPEELKGLRLLWRGFFRVLAATWMLVYFRWRVRNRPRLAGGFVLVANHSSFLDPIVLGAASPQPVRFLINSMSHRSPAMGWLFRLFSSIPIDPRGGNRDSLRLARASLESGKVVGVFPEGGITRDGGLLLGNTGAVALVLSKDVCIVPVGLRGVAAALPYGAVFPRPRRIEVHFGEPIRASELMTGDGDRKARLARATERIMREIGKLTGQESREDELRRQRAAAAGRT
jgi:1-acyl-sn-glycerol-3-phosphate acyltransferase